MTEIKIIVNCTPHPIMAAGRTFAPSGIIPRVATIEVPSEDLDGIPCVIQRMGEVERLPEPVANTWLIVSAMVFSASDRLDLIAPDTGKGAIRDEQGRILGVTRFLRKG